MQGRRAPAVRSPHSTASRRKADADFHTAHRPRLGIDLELPDALRAGCGVDAAQRRLQQRRILNVGDLALPEVEIHDGVAIRQRRRIGEERLIEVARGLVREQLGEDAVDIDAAGLQR